MTHWMVAELEKEVHVFPLQKGHVFNSNCFCYPVKGKQQNCLPVFIHEEVRGDGKEK